MSERIKSNSSIDRALSIIEFIVSREEDCSLTDIVQALAIPKTTTFRILETLTKREYIEWDESTEKYSVGLKTLELGFKGLRNNDLVETAAPYLQELSEITGETCFLGVLNESEVVYLYKKEGTNSIRTSAQLGSKRPSYCTGLGKAILSALSIEEVEKIINPREMKKITDNTITNFSQLHEELRDARIKGFAIDQEENELGVTCYSVPIFNYTGNVIGSISCAGPTKQINMQKDLIIDKIKFFGEQISMQLGFVESMRMNRI